MSQKELRVFAAQGDDPLRPQEKPLHGKVLPGGLRAHLLGQDIHDPVRALQQRAHQGIESARAHGSGGRLRQLLDVSDIGFEQDHVVQLDPLFLAVELVEAVAGGKELRDPREHGPVLRRDPYFFVLITMQCAHTLSLPSILRCSGDDSLGGVR